MTHDALRTVILINYRGSLHVFLNYNIMFRIATFKIMFIHCFYMLIVQFIRIQVVIKKMSQRLQPHSSWQMHCIRRITSYKDATGEAIFLQLILLRLFLIFFYFLYYYLKKSKNTK